MGFCVTTIFASGLGFLHESLGFYIDILMGRLGLGLLRHGDFCVWAWLFARITGLLHERLGFTI